MRGYTLNRAMADIAVNRAEDAIASRWQIDNALADC